MIKIQISILAIGIAFLFCTSAFTADKKEEKEIEKDPVTGMIIAEHWETTRNHCIICHSPQQFLRQKGTKVTWTEIVKWMQKDAGLWKLDPVIESQIIDYLAGNYGPSGAYRRAPVPATLLPPNPYESNIAKEVEEKRKAGLIPNKAPAKK